MQCTMMPSPNEGPETSAQVRLQTSGGILCTLDIARAEAQRRGTAEWIGKNGTVKADWVTRQLTRSTSDGGSQSWTLEPRPTILAVLQAFVRAVRTGTAPPVTGLDGCLAVEAADACYRSAARHGAVMRCEPAFAIQLPRR